MDMDRTYKGARANNLIILLQHNYFCFKNVELKIKLSQIRLASVQECFLQVFGFESSVDRFAAFVKNRVRTNFAFLPLRPFRIEVNEE